MKKGLACTVENIENGWDLIELQFEKSVPRHVEVPQGNYSVHAPYYGTLVAKEQKVRDTIQRAIQASKIAEQVGAKLVIVHPGFYAKQTKETALSVLRESIRELLRSTRSIIGIETMPRSTELGTLEQVNDLAKEFTRVQGIYNLSSIQKREHGVPWSEIPKNAYCQVDKDSPLEKAVEELPDATFVAIDEEAKKALQGFHLE